MARRRITIAECDLCNSDRDVKRVRMDVEGRTGRTADLCANHRKPVSDLLDKIEEVRPTRRSVTAIPLTPMSEVKDAAAAARRSEASRRANQTRRAATTTTE